MSIHNKYFEKDMVPSIRNSLSNLMDQSLEAGMETTAYLIAMSINELDEKELQAITKAKVSKSKKAKIN